MTKAAGDTIVALSSGRPPAAIAVVRISGPSAFEAAEALSGPLGPPRQANLRTLRDPRDGSHIDQALVLCFAAPGTATGENIVEYQCHGGRAVVDTLVAALVAQPGLRLAEPGEFTRRALLNGKIDLTQAEGLAELLEAETEAQRKSALRRSEGALRTTIEGFRGAVLALSAEAEVAIDYADEAEGTVSFEPSQRLGAIIAEIDALLSAPRVEKLRDGVRVVVAGPPNAGKSSLVNALAGQERAIVTPVPGTTRDRIEVPLSLSGIPIVLVDTAGLRATDDEVERIGVGLAEREVAEADVILWLGDARDLPGGAIGIASKCDVERKVDGLAVSAATGEGLHALKHLLAERAESIVPAATQLALNSREAELLNQCRRALDQALSLSNPVLMAEELRCARVALDRISGLAGVEEMLDALFGRFCLGK